MWGSDNRNMGLHVTDQRQDPIPCLAPPVPQEHSPRHLELLVLFQFLLPLARVDNAGMIVPKKKHAVKMTSMAGSVSMTVQRS